MKATIEPDAAATLLEDVDGLSENKQRILREIADGDEPREIAVSRDSAKEFVTIAVVEELKQEIQQGELGEELTRFDAGRFVGLLDFYLLLEEHDVEKPDSIEQGDVLDLFPKAVQEMAESEGLYEKLK